MIEQLDYLLMIDEKRNISKAAEALYISQPALSKQLRQVEKKLGFRIFDRERNMIPTYEGSIFLDSLKRQKNDYVQTMRVINDIMETYSGSIHLGIPSNRAGYVFGMYLASFIKGNPEIHVDMISKPIKYLINDLENRKIDMACMVPHVSGEHLSYTRIVREPLSIIADPALLKEKIRPDGSVSLRDLNGIPYIGLRSDFRLRNITDRLFEKHGIVKEPLIETESMQLISTLVREGMGFTISTASQMDVFPAKADGIGFYTISEDPMFWELGYAVRGNEYLSNMYLKFVEGLKHYLLSNDAYFESADGSAE